MQIGIFDGIIWLCLYPGTYDETCLQNGSGNTVENWLFGQWAHE